MSATNHTDSRSEHADDGHVHEWTEHEHLSDPIRAAAERLLESAGSPGIAKHVIDVVHDQPLNDTIQTRELAERYGFTSCQALLSTAFQSTSDSRWRIVSLPDGRWLAWNQDSLESVVRESRVATENWIQQGRHS